MCDGPLQARDADPVIADERGRAGAGVTSRQGEGRGQRDDTKAGGAEVLGQRVPSDTAEIRTPTIVRGSCPDPGDYVGSARISPAGAATSSPMAASRSSRHQSSSARSRNGWAATLAAAGAGTSGSRVAGLTTEPG